MSTFPFQYIGDDGILVYLARQFIVLKLFRHLSSDRDKDMTGIRRQINQRRYFCIKLRISYNNESSKHGVLSVLAIFSSIALFHQYFRRNQLLLTYI